VFRRLVGWLPSHREDLAGAVAVQIVWSSRRGSRNIEHIGSAHDDGELEALTVAARGRAPPPVCVLVRETGLSAGLLDAHAGLAYLPGTVGLRPQLRRRQGGEHRELRAQLASHALVPAVTTGR
jgi:hypothetical protein